MPNGVFSARCPWAVVELPATSMSERVCDRGDDSPKNHWKGAETPGIRIRLGWNVLFGGEAGHTNAKQTIDVKNTYTQSQTSTIFYSLAMVEALPQCPTCCFQNLDKQFSSSGKDILRLSVNACINKFCVCGACTASRYKEHNLHPFRMHGEESARSHIFGCHHMFLLFIFF